MLVFDVETTGIDPLKDQVIELALGSRIDGREVLRFKPSVEIVPGAYEAHGISEKDLKDEPTFDELAHQVHNRFVSAQVLCGYNVQFDIDFMQAEFARAGLPELDLESKRIVDVYEIWKKLEPKQRTLQQAHQRFLGERFDGAHSAVADIKATEDVLWAMLDEYGYEEITAEQWDDLCTPVNNHVSEDGKLLFGKHKGAFVNSVDPGYIRWMLKQDFPKHVKDSIRKWK